MSLLNRLLGRPDIDANLDYERRLRDADDHAAREHQRRDTESYWSAQRRDDQAADDRYRRDRDDYGHDRRYRDFDSRDRDY